MLAFQNRYSLYLIQYSNFLVEPDLSDWEIISHPLAIWVDIKAW